MNEENLKVNLGNKKKTQKRLNTFQSFFVKPSSKFWKRLFNKRVRKGEVYKSKNWFEWS